MDEMALPEADFQALIAGRLSVFLGEWTQVQEELKLLEQRGSAMMYKAQSAGLKDFKKDLMGAQKRWRDALEAEKQIGLEALFGKGSEVKIKEYRQRYFNWKLPVERTLNVLEWYLQNPERTWPESNIVDCLIQGGFRIL
jgi:hypothetical protein